MKKIIAAFLLFIVCSFSNLTAQKKTEIIWDNYGVPHIDARSEAEMYYAFGWAQMHNHANLLLQLYGQARGRSAEYWGADYLEADKLIHLFNIPDSAKSHYSRQPPADKINLDAFVNGLNGYATAHPNKIDDKVKKILPVVATDVLSHAAKVIYFDFLASEDISETKRQLAPGSNAYAISPSRSASKNAMLVTNPHLPWGDFYLFFEAQLTSPGFNAYGVSLIGMPTLNIAFNDYLGWTHTVNTIDASDRYELSLLDGGYLLDGKIIPFQKKKIALQSLQKDGSLQPQEIELKYSQHGPVMGEKANKAYAVRIAGLENISFSGQYHAMAKAKNITEFEAALRMMQNPMFNVVYADKAGNILYLFNGNIPVRQEKEWSFWNGNVDGTQSKYIWNKYHPYADLPRLLNPATGFVQNANDPPWIATYPSLLNPAKYPGYMSPQEMPFRPQRSVNMIRKDSSISFEELVGYKLNTGVEAAERFLDDLFLAVQQHPDTLATRAAMVLQNWDRATNTDSRGAVLFTRWFDKLNENMFAIPWSLRQPVTTPDGLKDPKQAVDLLVKAAMETQKMYGSLDVAWGEVHRFKIGDYDYPANGGSGNYGIYRTMYYQTNRQTNKRYAYFGDSYVAITEFGKKVSAQVLLSYGNATQPGSKHIGDQLKLLSEKKLRPALLTKEDALANTEEKEVLEISN